MVCIIFGGVDGCESVICSFFFLGCVSIVCWIFGGVCFRCDGIFGGVDCRFFCVFGFVYFGMFFGWLVYVLFVGNCVFCCDCSSIGCFVCVSFWVFSGIV